MTRDEAIEVVGRMADKADNLLHAAKLPVPAQLHVVGLVSGLVEMQKALSEAFIALGGEP